MNHTKEERDQKIRQYISDFEGSNSNTEDNGSKEDQEAFNFYFNIEPCPSYYSDPKVEAFWTEFARE